MVKLLTLFSVLPASLAALVTVSIPSTALVNPSTLPATTHATLEEFGVKLNAPLTRANTFAFHNVTQGSYLLSVFSKDFLFENLRIDVADGTEGAEQKVEAWQTFRGNEWDNKGEARNGVLPGQVEVRPIIRKDFYQARSTFSVLSFLKSPMILMALFSMLMIFGMPYLMDNMDPDSRKEFEEMQKNSALGSASNSANAFQNFDLAGWMAGSGTSTPQSGAKRRG